MKKMRKNRVKYGLCNVHYAKITGWAGGEKVPLYNTPVRIPGAVSLSLEPSGATEIFHADNVAYYISSHNSGYTGELEIALTPTNFLTEILGEIQDENGVLIEKNNDSTAQFALLFEINGDLKHTRHCFYCCSASRPSTASSTITNSKQPQTDTLSLTALALPNGLIKTRTTPETEPETHEKWYEKVYDSADIPEFEGGSFQTEWVESEDEFFKMETTENVLYFVGEK